jgi:hypothetical protein
MLRRAKLSGDISCQWVLSQVIIYILFMNHVRMPHRITLPVRLRRSMRGQAYPLISVKEISTGVSDWDLDTCHDMKELLKRSTWRGVGLPRTQGGRFVAIYVGISGSCASMRNAPDLRIQGTFFTLNCFSGHFSIIPFYFVVYSIYTRPCNVVTYPFASVPPQRQPEIYSLLS